MKENFFDQVLSDITTENTKFDDIKLSKILALIIR